MKAKKPEAPGPEISTSASELWKQSGAERKRLRETGEFYLHLREELRRKNGNTDVAALVRRARGQED